ncbi:FUN14 domain-containing protein [Halogeometricum sp. S1BR25-6]|uniref:FUN14 domain-containing protein n=1 Tax=Halogeometricum salsisoli TaxID=2950536 RepID=A0ABU2GCY2_9EURY|nr:FUN14 domain-containing protein [Halogeometricum sp. S1BR25-6]MDS0298676.1 FUN14 domain-containing protein [Halogeometricum sp. S1BR25-6]
MSDPLQLSLDPTALGFEFGGGAVVGGIIGFAAKKVAKLLAVVVGLQMALFKFLESRGILAVDWERLTAGMLKTTETAASGAPPSWLSTLLSTLSVSAGFTGGFLVGFKKG